MSRVDKIFSATPFGEEVADQNSVFHTFPSVCRLTDGTILCSSLVGKTKSGPEGRIRVVRSRDGMRSWVSSPSPSEPDEANPLYGYIMCHMTEVSAVKPGYIVAVYLRVLRKNHSEPLFHPKTDGMQPSEVRTAVSEDFGHTWSKPRPIEFELPDLIVPGKCIVLPSGDLGIPCEVWHEWDKGWSQWPSSRLIISHDAGRSWKTAAVMAKDEKRQNIYGDPRLTICPDGRVMSLFWRYSLSDGKDYPVHRSFSRDSGLSWDIPEAVPLEAQISCPVSLTSGLTLCVYQKRFGEGAGVRAVLSRDECGSFENETDILLWESPKKTASKNPFSGYEDFQFGYTTCLKETDSEVLVSFWAGNGRTSCMKLLRLKIEA